MEKTITGYTEDEVKVMEAALARHHAEIEKKAALEKENACLKEFSREVHSALLKARMVAPETDEERKMWKRIHGAEYNGRQDLSF